MTNIKFGHAQCVHAAFYLIDLLIMGLNYTFNVSFCFLCWNRKFGGRELVSVSFVIQHESRNLSFYVHNSTDELLMLVAKNFEGFQENGRCYKQSVMIGHVASLRDKPLHGQFLREITDKICVKSQWLWLRKSKEMEGLSFAAQELTNSI